jgi:hypothetical protein
MRTCQRIGCENSLDDLRADANYCGATCKREGARQRSRSRDGSTNPDFWVAYAQVRRPRRCTAAHTPRFRRNR